MIVEIACFVSENPEDDRIINGGEGDVEPSDRLICGLGKTNGNERPPSLTSNLSAKHISPELRLIIYADANRDKTLLPENLVRNFKNPFVNDVTMMFIMLWWLQAIVLLLLQIIMSNALCTNFPFHNFSLQSHLTHSRLFSSSFSSI